MRSALFRKTSRSGDTGAVCAASGWSSAKRFARFVASSRNRANAFVRMMVPTPYFALSFDEISSRKPSHFSSSGFSGLRKRMTRRASTGLSGSRRSTAPASSVMPVRYWKCGCARKSPWMLASMSPAKTTATESFRVFSTLSRREAYSASAIPWREAPAAAGEGLAARVFFLAMVGSV